MSTHTSTPRKLSALDFNRMKKEKRKISMVTCYDFAYARVLADTEIDMLLVGDSCAMVMHGHPSTLLATPEMMATHTAAVSRGAPNKFLVTDMPFLSFRKGIAPALECVDLLMKAGAEALKIEGVRGHEETIRAIVESGVPVQGHLGLTPQSIHQMGGFKVQGRGAEQAQALLEDALTLERLGCFSVVLECVPSEIGRQISEKLTIPTIGIGAGPSTDGQVLVLQDMLGMNPDFQPKFLRHYFTGKSAVRDAVNRYHEDVLKERFPSASESYL
ncbi:MAG: 3-methyl-2-oxobutanoate hydroxymethyltransferase [Oligoflexia bacterium]|nr:3-methyl-2-oxobutanoate hydroxymethyltransferase [Oligoflexia bacterium]